MEVYTMDGVYRKELLALVETVKKSQCICKQFVMLAIARKQQYRIVANYRHDFKQLERKKVELFNLVVQECLETCQMAEDFVESFNQLYDNNMPLDTATFKMLKQGAISCNNVLLKLMHKHVRNLAY